MRDLFAFVGVAAILFGVFVIGFVLFDYEKPTEEQKQIQNLNVIDEFKEDLQIIVIDSCEYYYKPAGIYRSEVLTLKGNQCDCTN